MTRRECKSAKSILNPIGVAGDTLWSTIASMEIYRAMGNWVVTARQSARYKPSDKSVWCLIYTRLAVGGRTGVQLTNLFAN